MDKLTAIKIKYQDGTYSDEIPLSALAQHVDWDDNHSIVDIIGDVDFDTDGSIQTQINNILAQKGVANGIATLNSSGQVPSSQLPSYVDDVLEYASKSAFPSTGESGKIYVDKATNLTYRWSGSAYVEISPSLALGETSSTAYRGDRGKIAYDHSQTRSGNPHNVTKSEVGLGNVGNFKAVSTVASQGLTDTEKSNARTNIGAGTSSFSGSYNDLSNKPTIPTLSDAINSTSSTVAASSKAVKTAYDLAASKTSNTGTVTSVATGIGLTGGTITTSGTLKTKLKSETARTIDALSVDTSTSKLYPVVTDKSGYLAVGVPWTDNDTKNTAGSTDTSSKIFLIGATSQAANPQTYSHDTAYVGTDGQLYSGGNKVLTSHQTIKQDGVSGATANRFGVCSTGAATAAKTVSITSGTFNLESGAQVSVKFSNTNSANNPTLNVNSTGAKNIFVNGSQITAGSEKSLLKGTVSFVYDGTQWHLIGGGSDSPSVMEITKAQYDALPESAKNDGTIYLITDGTGGWEAERSTYDNTQSGLAATNVQDALDELESNSVKLDTDVQNLVSADSLHLGWDTVSGYMIFDMVFPTSVRRLAWNPNNILYQLITSSGTSEEGHWERIEYRSSVYTHVTGDHVFLTVDNPGSNYRLINAYNGDWADGRDWLPAGIMYQGDTPCLFFNKSYTDATLRINTAWIHI